MRTLTTGSSSCAYRHRLAHRFVRGGDRGSDARESRSGPCRGLVRSRSREGSRIGGRPCPRIGSGTGSGLNSDSCPAQRNRGAAGSWSCGRREALDLDVRRCPDPGSRRAGVLVGAVIATGFVSGTGRYSGVGAYSWLIDSPGRRVFGGLRVIALRCVVARLRVARWRGVVGSSG